MSYKIINRNVDNLLGNKENRKQIASFLPIIPEWTMKDVILSNQLREQLEDVIAFCANKNKIVHEWGLHRFLKGAGGCIGINFWGIPGTGKSIVAEAIADALGKKIIQVSYSSLMDSLQGNTEKNISSLFETAVNEDCVVLFDEADGLLSTRKTGSTTSDSTNLIKSHLLNLLDRSSAIVIFTTNLFKSYDRAFVRRILWNIEFKAPNMDELTKLWAFHLGPNIPKDITYVNLAELTKQLADAKGLNITGGDVKKLTLMFCTSLSANRFSTINQRNVEKTINKYLDDLQEQKPMSQAEVEVPNDQLPLSIKNNL